MQTLQRLLVATVAALALGPILAVLLTAEVWMGFYTGWEPVAANDNSTI